MAAYLIFAATFVVLAIGRFPGLRIDRAGAAIVGASLMVASGVLRFDEALRAVDWSTIVLLLGMMIVVANLHLSGFFRLVAARVVEHAHSPKMLLAGVIAVSGVLSAFFVNDTMCIVLTPLVVHVTRELRRNPVPYLLAVALAANCGSVATITGNPQNMMIGALSGIPYRQFAAALAPVAAVSLLVTWAALVVAFREEFSPGRFDRVDVGRIRVNRPMLWKAAAVAAGMVVFFFRGWPVAQTAIVAGALLLITRRVKPEKVYHDIDWPLLAMFAGLFIVVRGFETTAIERDLLDFAEGTPLDRPAVLSFFAALVSNLVSNVPAVLLFKPVVVKLADPVGSWLTLAMASTLAGNFTLVGSVANLIVVERARPEVQIRFMDHFRVGAPLTVLTLAAGAAWLEWIR
ncbi:MAG: anion transporter [Bryobacteraceae bacterium]|nr:anion transporter [Bryobacteraceae bacterium]